MFLDMFNVNMKNSCVFCFSFDGFVYFLCGSAQLSQAITANGGYEACVSGVHCSALMFSRLIPPFVSEPRATILFSFWGGFNPATDMFSTVY